MHETAASPNPVLTGEKKTNNAQSKSASYVFIGDLTEDYSLRDVLSDSCKKEVRRESEYIEVFERKKK